MTAHDDLFIADLLLRCDFSRRSANHKSALRTRLLKQTAELTDDEQEAVPDSGEMPEIMRPVRNKEIFKV